MAAHAKIVQAQVALEREKEEHRAKMKIAIDKLDGSEIGRRIIELVGEEELYKYDPESLNSLHIDAVIKHSREQKEKLKVQYKKVDFLIRAQHEAEVSLIQDYSQEDTRLRRDIQLAERERAIERRERLIRMEDDKRDFLQSIRGQRHDDYVLKMQEYNQQLQIARQQRLEQLRKEHIEKKKQEFRKNKQLEKQRKEREKQEKIQSEAKRKQDKVLAEKREADAKRFKELDKQAEIQRERERAIEEKLQAERGGGPTTTRRPAPSTHHEKERPDGFVHS